MRSGRSCWSASGRGRRAMSSVELVASGWWSWMTAMSWQAAVLVVVVAVLDRLLERTAWTQLRYGLWLLVAVKLVLPPELASRWSVVPRVLDGGAVPAGEAAAIPRMLPAALAVWLAVALAWVGVTACRSWRFGRRQLGRSRPAPAAVLRPAEWAAARLGLRTARVRVSDVARSPFVLGLLRPTVVLPSEACARWTEGELRDVLLHELAHVRRGDLWVEAAFRLLNGIYWFHPLVYVMRRRAHATRELAADACAARHLGPDAGRYRQTLARFAAERLLGDRPAALGYFGGHSVTLARLRALDRGSWRSPRLRGLGAWVVVAVLAVLLVPMASRPDGRRAELQRAVDDARSRFELVAEERPGTGSLHYRYAVMQLRAAEQRLADSTGSNVTGGEDE